ncbi:MAG: hypothetical protein NTY41_14990 [Proteobacteria bacterium]|nr:hypothetical protein [Pseudomonadota bacterium]
MIDQRATIAAIVLSVIGAATFLVMPVVLGAAVTAFDFSESEVGLVAALLMAGNALSAASALFWVRLLDWRVTSRGALLLQGLALAALTQANGFVAVGLWFLCASLGGGAVYSLALTVLSDHKHSDRVFGYAITAQVAFQLAGMLMLSHFSESGGFNRLMWGLAALVPVGLLLTGWLPQRGKVGATAAIVGILRQRKVVMALLGCLVFYFNVGCVWAYVERMGAAAGFTPEGLGNALALGVAAGMAGSLTASWQGPRFGRVVPLGWGAGGTVLAVAFLLPEVGLGVFVVALALYNFVFNYSLTYQYAVIAAADESGRCVAVAAAFQMAGGAMGPAMAALLVGSGNFLAVNVLAAIGAIVSFGLFLSAARVATPQEA